MAIITITLDTSKLEDALTFGSFVKALEGNQDAPVTETPAKVTQEAPKKEEAPNKTPAKAVKETPAKKEETITSDTLRSLAVAKIQSAEKNRELLKAKLEELGSISISALEESQFDEFYKFLNGLD